MFVTFWGVRGSYPVPGVATNRFGGNTACVEVGVGGGDGPTLIIDAGTGIRRLGQHLLAGPLGRGQGSCDLLISHTHWDHIQGLPFFSPLYIAGNRVTIYGRQRDVHLRSLVSRQVTNPYFPVDLAEAEAEIEVRELMEGTAFDIGPIKVSCARLNHPYLALGYRLETEGVAVAYASDTAPFDRIVLGYEFIRQPPSDELLSDHAAAELAAMREGLIDLCRGADLVIYDTMFETAEYEACPHWGHSAPEHALEILEAAGARCLALFHHAPQRSDEEQQAIVDRVKAAASMEVIGAREGLKLELPSLQASEVQR